MGRGTRCQHGSAHRRCQICEGMWCVECMCSSIASMSAQYHPTDAARYRVSRLTSASKSGGPPLTRKVPVMQKSVMM